MGGMMGEDGWLIGPDSVTDTAIDLTWSGHKGDETDLLGPSLGNPQDEPLEDNISVRDPDTGEWLGFTNTPQMPSGESAENEATDGEPSGNSPGGDEPTGLGDSTLLWAVLLIAGVYAAGQVFDIDLGGS